MKNSIERVNAASKLLNQLATDMNEGKITPKEVETVCGMVIRQMGDIQFEMSLETDEQKHVDFIMGQSGNRIPDIDSVEMMESSQVRDWMWNNKIDQHQSTGIPAKLFWIKSEEGVFYMKSDLKECLDEEILRKLECSVETRLVKIEDTEEV